MTAPTVAVEWLLARAAVRQTGRLHLVSRRDTDALNPLCGANPIRSREIETHTSIPADVPLCPDCTDLVGRLRTTISALLDPSSAAATLQLLDVPVASISVRPTHARRSPGDDFEQLTASIADRGIVTPLLLRRLGDGFEIVDGARRLVAAHDAGRITVPAFIRETDDDEVLLDSLIANLHRADLNPIDQAHAYRHALETIADLKGNKAELGRRLGISREQVSNTLRLLGLPQEDQDRIAEGELTAEGGRALLRTGNRPAPAKLTDVADLLAQLLDAKVAVTDSGDRTRFVFDVPNVDRDRFLAQLGRQAVSA